jgi:hypothetical protein
MSSTILFIKYARQSTIKFGKYTGLTIERVIAIGKGRYLAHIYFEIPNISFTDDVLNLLSIKECHRFTKPGINLTLSNAHFKRFNHRSVSALILKRRKEANIKTKEEMMCKPSVLQSKNHGHSNYRY